MLSSHLIISAVSLKLRGWRCHLAIFIDRFSGDLLWVVASYGIMIVSLGIDFWLCEVFNRDTPVELGATFVIVAYGCDDDGKNIVFECNNEPDFEVWPGQFEMERPKMMHCEFVPGFACDWTGWFKWRGCVDVVFSDTYYGTFERLTFELMPEGGNSSFWFRKVSLTTEFLGKILRNAGTIGLFATLDVDRVPDTMGISFWPDTCGFVGIIICGCGCDLMSAFDWAFALGFRGWNKQFFKNQYSFWPPEK